MTDSDRPDADNIPDGSNSDGSQAQSGEDTASGGGAGDSGQQSEDDGTVPDKQIHRWKDDGGPVMPDPAHEHDDE